MNYKDKNWFDYSISYLKTFEYDVPVYTPAVFREFRGEIFTTYHSTMHPVNNLTPNDCNIHSRFSYSYKNVLRGLHYDSKTWKLVQAVLGDIYLVVLDYRIDSSRYGKWESYILSEKTRDQVLIPPGFANGHFALTDCMFHYTMFYKDEYVNETQQGVVKWNDAKFNIKWPCADPILQERDK